jgi:hypothetical protein
MVLSFKASIAKIRSQLNTYELPIHLASCTLGDLADVS